MKAAVARRLTAGIAIIAIAIGGCEIAPAAVAEYQLSRAIGAADGLTIPPDVTIGGLGFLPRSRSGSFPSITVTARIPGYVPGTAAVAARRDTPSATARPKAILTDVRAAGGARITGSSEVSVARIAGSVLITQNDLGLLLGITDLEILTPSPDPAGALTPVAINRNARGLVLTGTVPLTDGAQKVSVAVDVALRGGRVQLTPTGLYSGPELHVTAELTAADTARALAAFAAVLPAVAMPFGVPASDVYGENTALVIAGTSSARTTQLVQFTQAS